MKATIIGAGRIGRGLIGELMVLNNVDIALFDINKEMIDQLNHFGEYTIHILGNESKNVAVEKFDAYMLDNPYRLAEVWLESDFIFTAVGGKNLPSIASILAEAFKIMIKNNDSLEVSNIVTCENWINPVKDLKDAIYANLEKDQIELFNKYIGISESVVLTTGTEAPTDEISNPNDTWLQDLPYLPVNKELIKGEIPNWEYIEFVEDFGDLLTQKVYTNNTSVATVSYLGHLNGIKYVADAANHAEILPILDQVYEEVNELLVEGLGIDAESQKNFSVRAKAKYTDPEIVDLVTRIARDPIRKLGPEDRFIGPMSIALRANIKPRAIAKGAAAAIYYDNDEDETAKKLKELRKKHGVDYIFENICKINPNGEIAELINKSIQELKEKGWINENE